MRFILNRHADFQQLVAIELGEPPKKLVLRVESSTVSIKDAPLKTARWTTS